MRHGVYYDHRCNLVEFAFLDGEYVVVWTYQSINNGKGFLSWITMESFKKIFFIFG